MNLSPVLPMASPFFRDIHSCQIQHFQKAVIRWENRFAFSHFPELTIESFNGICGVNQASYCLRIFEISGQGCPVIMPELCTFVFSNIHSKEIFFPIHVDTKSNVNRTFYNTSFTADMIMDCIHKYYSIHFFQRAFLPFFYNRQDLLRFHCFLSYNMETGGGLDEIQDFSC